MTTPVRGTKETVSAEILTIAAIRTPEGKGPVEYLFNERAQIFSMRPALKLAEASSKLLKEAFDKKIPVKVFFDPKLPFIEKIETPLPAEAEAFHRARVLLEKPEAVMPFDAESVDHSTFNIVEHFLNIPIFKLCTKVVPNYAKAKQIFDYCAAQSCNLPGPYGISPCIPFQYVRDGCYARAHKMRWIITTKYGYCCEKVFSFANQNSDTLAVKADKWGGCCVTWWYHVAPLIRVQVSFKSFSFQLAYVIDPGMFNAPVTLSTWLGAQANTACNAHAKVSMHSIQPGTAYSPANYAGTAFTTDPNYTATDATLNAYKNLITCP